MARPSRNTDRRLIAAARTFLPVTGCSGLNLRQVAARAKVNLGMFHYHFGSKEEFIRQVLAEVYEEFFGRFSFETTPEVGQPDGALEALRRGITVLGRFARDNRTLVLALIGDVLSGDKAVTAFLASNVQRHFGVLFSLVKRCQDEGLLRRDLPPIAVLVFGMGAVGFPSIAVELVGRVSRGLPKGKKPSLEFLSELENFVLTDEAIDARVRTALSALGGKV